MMSQITDDQRRLLLGDATFMLKLLWYVTRRRYGRLASRAFVDVVDEPVAEQLR